MTHAKTQRRMTAARGSSAPVCDSMMGGGGDWAFDVVFCSMWEGCCGLKSRVWISDVLLGSSNVYESCR